MSLWKAGRLRSKSLCQTDSEAHAAFYLDDM